MRDTQKSKVYKWERSLPSWLPCLQRGRGFLPERCHTPMTLDECNRLNNKVWRLYFSEQSVGPMIHDGRGCRVAIGGAFDLKLPRWVRFPAGVLHEIGHAIVGRAQMHRNVHRPLTERERWPAAHGPEFASLLVSLLSRYADTGMSRGALARSARAAGVKLATAAATPKTLRKRTPKQRVVKVSFLNWPTAPDFLAYFYHHAERQRNEWLRGKAQHLRIRLISWHSPHRCTECGAAQVERFLLERLEDDGRAWDPIDFECASCGRESLQQRAESIIIRNPQGGTLIS